MWRLKMTEARKRFKSRAKAIGLSFRVFNQTTSFSRPIVLRRLTRGDKQLILEQLRDPKQDFPDLDPFLSEIVRDTDFVDNCLSECMKTNQVTISWRSGGGASGRATAFCPSETGVNPGTDLSFFRNAFNLFSRGHQAISKRMGHKMVLTLPSSFLFPIL